MMDLETARRVVNSPSPDLGDDCILEACDAITRLSRDIFDIHKAAMLSNAVKRDARIAEASRLETRAALAFVSAAGIVLAVLIHFDPIGALAQVLAQ